MRAWERKKAWGNDRCVCHFFIHQLGNSRNSISTPKTDPISRAGNQAHFRNESIELHGRAMSDTLMRAGALLAR